MGLTLTIFNSGDGDKDEFNYPIQDAKTQHDTLPNFAHEKIHHDEILLCSIDIDEMGVSAHTIWCYYLYTSSVYENRRWILFVFLSRFLEMEDGMMHKNFYAELLREALGGVLNRQHLSSSQRRQ